MFFFYTKMFTTLYITMYKNVIRALTYVHAFVCRYNTFLSFVSNRIFIDEYLERDPHHAMSKNYAYRQGYVRLQFQFFLNGIMI